MQYILNAEIRFAFAILFILVQGVDGVEVRYPQGAHYKPRPIRLKHRTLIYLTHARTATKPDSPFLSSFIGKRDMPDMASEEENVDLECE